jgi:hypothetical protein
MSHGVGSNWPSNLQNPSHGKRGKWKLTAKLPVQIRLILWIVSNSTAMACQSLAANAVHAAIGGVPFACRRSVIGLAELPARHPTFFFTLYLSLSQHTRGPSVAPLHFGLLNVPNSKWDPSPVFHNETTRHNSDRLISFSGSFPILKNETLFSDRTARPIQFPSLNMLSCEFRDFGVLTMLRLRGGISGRRGRCGALRYAADVYHLHASLHMTVASSPSAPIHQTCSIDS